MTAKAKAHDTARKEGQIVSFPIVGSAAKILKGAPIFIDSNGYAFSNDGTTNALTAGDVFVGISDETVDNSEGASGDLEVSVWIEGVVSMPSTVTATQAFVGQEALVNDVTDDAGITRTDAASGQPQVAIGTIVKFVDADNVLVKLNKFATAVANVA